MVYVFLLSFIFSSEGSTIGAYKRIEEAYKIREIDYDKYLLYKSWATFNPKKLDETPYALSPEEIKPTKCGTPLILEIKRNWKKLSKKTKEELSFAFERPTDTGGGVDSKQHLLPQCYFTEHFVFHWTNGIDDGGSSADAPPLDDADSSGTPDYIEELADVFEDVWSFEITTRGFDTPPSDAGLPSNDENDRNPDGKYDVFVYNMSCYGYAQSEYSVEATPENDATSLIGVENDYSGFPGTQLGCMQVTAAHEFHHAIQFGYDYQEEPWWMETTSTYMEDEVYPDVDDNYQYLSYWFEYCDSYGLKSTTGLHEYGNFIWAKRLSEDFGDEVIKEIWEECQYLDGLLAIDNVLKNKGSNLKDEFAKFTKANFFLEDMYIDGAGYRAAVNGTWNPLFDTTFDGVWLEYQYSSEGIPFTIDSSNVNDDCWMDKWATDYITFTLDPSIQYTISFNGSDTTTDYLVNLVTKKDVSFSEQIFSLDAQKDGSIDLPCDTYNKVVLIIMNAGDTDDPSWKVTITETSPPSLTITETSPPSPPSGGGGGGCFIATAAFGTEMAEEVKALKKFRDDVLLKTVTGRDFVKLYYSISPLIAKFISHQPLLKAIVRSGLKPLIWFSRDALRFH